VNTSYKKKFLKDLDKIPKQVRHKVQEIVFDQIPQTRSIHDIEGLKKIQRFSGYYRLRISDYRIGLIAEKNKVVFCRVLHRKDIYKYFP
jgi:mRNA interferase RelE/StbE